jgi:hypothetical protein
MPEILAWHTKCIEGAASSVAWRGIVKITKTAARTAIMKRMTQMLAIAGVACVASFGSNKAFAQQDNGGGGGGRRFDPAQRMERLKEDLEVKDDEWTALQPLIQKVMDAQRAIFADRMRGFMRGGRAGGDNGGGGNGGDNGGRRRGGFGGPAAEPSPEAEALQKAIESKASNSEMKAALAKYQESRKAKQAELETAQANLRKVLSVRQEAILTAQGLL